MSEREDIEKKLMEIIESRSPSTVRELVEAAHAKLSLPKEKLLDIVLDLHSEGRLRLNQASEAVPSDLKAYLFTTGSLWFWLVISLSAATSAAVFLIPEGAYPIVLARYALGSLFVLFLPGFCLVKALFPTKEINNIERLALSIGMSLAVVPLVGLLLNYTPWGIRLTPITISLLSSTVLFSLIAVIREHSEKSLKLMQE